MGRRTGPELLPACLDLMIQRALIAGRLHGYGIAQQVESHSNDFFHVRESWLYPALQRPVSHGWAPAERASEKNPRARYCGLPPTERSKSAPGPTEFNAVVAVIQGALETA